MTTCYARMWQKDCSTTYGVPRVPLRPTAAISASAHIRSRKVVRFPSPPPPESTGVTGVGLQQKTHAEFHIQAINKFTQWITRNIHCIRDNHDIETNGCWLVNSLQVFKNEFLAHQFLPIHWKIQDSKPMWKWIDSSYRIDYVNIL